MTLRDLFEMNPDGTYKSRLGSVGEALVEEKNREYNDEQPQEEPDGGGGYDESGGLGQGDNMMADQSQGVGPSEKFLNRMISIKGIPKPVPGAKEPGFRDLNKNNYGEDCKISYTFLKEMETPNLYVLNRCRLHFVF